MDGGTEDGPRRLLTIGAGKGAGAVAAVAIKYGHEVMVSWCRIVAAPIQAAQIQSDYAAAKIVVVDLLDQFGFNVVDADPLVERERFQRDTPGYGAPLDSKKLQEALAAV